MAVRQQETIVRKERIQDAQRPSPLNATCLCVQSPCNCGANAINESAFSAVAKPLPPEAPDPKPEEPSIVDRALDEVGEIADAVVDAGKKLLSGAVDTVSKPVVGAGKGILDEARSFVGGLNDTIRFGLVAIAIALVIALLLGIVFVNRR
jgi:hypothetical protein